MNFDQQNPYMAPQSTGSFNEGYEVAADAATVKKAELIIKDAGQFWIAILICIFCTGLGAIIIGPWYLIRLRQWKSLANSQPLLLDKNVSKGSLAQRFQSAKIQLIVGVCFGGAVLLLVAVAIVVRILADYPAP